MHTQFILIGLMLSLIIIAAVVLYNIFWLYPKEMDNKMEEIKSRLKSIGIDMDANSSYVLSMYGHDEYIMHPYRLYMYKGDAFISAAMFVPGSGGIYYTEYDVNEFFDEDSEVHIHKYQSNEYKPCLKK